MARLGEDWRGLARLARIGREAVRGGGLIGDEAVNDFVDTLV